MHLAKRYSRVQLEDACKHVIATNQFIGYRSIKGAIVSIDDNTDSTKHTRTAPEVKDVTINDVEISFTHAHLRGADAFKLPTRATTTTETGGRNDGDNNRKEEQ